MTKQCTECEQEIHSERLRLLPRAQLCTACQAEHDVFKFKMKTVGFNEEPTVARTEKDWKILKKQRAVKDI